MKRGIYGALWASRFIRFHNREEVLSTMVNIDRIVTARNEYWAVVCVVVVQFTCGQYIT